MRNFTNQTSSLGSYKKIDKKKMKSIPFFSLKNEVDNYKGRMHMLIEF